MTEQAFKLLREFYPPEGLYLRELSKFSTSTSSITGRFCVPTDAAYSITELNYVTTEQYVRCISQLSYALVYLLAIYHDGLTLYGTSKEFEKLMLSGRMWYRRMNFHFREQNIKGEGFFLGLELTRMKALGEFTVACLALSGSVSGNLEFVAPRS